jgi:hypothetical protein
MIQDHYRQNDKTLQYYGGQFNACAGDVESTVQLSHCRYPLISGLPLFSGESGGALKAQGVAD